MKKLLILAVITSLSLHGFTIENNIGKGPDALPMPVIITGVTVRGIKGVPGQFDPHHEKYQHVANALINESIDQVHIPDTVSGLQVTIGKAVFQVSNIPQLPNDQKLILTGKYGSYSLASKEGAKKSVSLKLDKSQEKKPGYTDINIPDLPPEIFSIKRLDIPAT